jgi:hypothetical protein
MNPRVALGTALCVHPRSADPATAGQGVGHSDRVFRPHRLHPRALPRVSTSTTKLRRYTQAHAQRHRGCKSTASLSPARFTPIIDEFCLNLRVEDGRKIMMVDRQGGASAVCSTPLNRCVCGGGCAPNTTVTSSSRGLRAHARFSFRQCSSAAPPFGRSSSAT